jgi:large subunit ribosomal protein L19
MQSTILSSIENAQIRTDLPEFRVGDTVRVHYRIVEGEKDRIQVFQGVVIKRHRAGARSTFTVRKVSFGVGVERVFLQHSPRIDKVELVSRGVVRRARLFYLRELSGKAARLRDEKDAKLSRSAPPRARVEGAVRKRAETRKGSALRCSILRAKTPMLRRAAHERAANENAARSAG